MRFILSDEQRDFGASLDALLAASHPEAVARAWADGDHRPGLELWGRLAEQGITALGDPASGATPVDLVVAFEQLGRYAVPGPWVESVAYLPVALGADLSEVIATVAAPPHTPYALDADIADQVYLATDTGIAPAAAGSMRHSVDRTRRLFEVTATDPAAPGDLEAAETLAVLATSAQLLGCGERILRDSVSYVLSRNQFGRQIGSYQAIKHALADVRIALDFARPLVQGAALDPQPRDVSAAKVATADAAYLASRTGLQVHGAIGYTQEFDLSIWLTKVRALVGAWGTPAVHRARVLEALVN